MKIAPSILAADFANLAADVARVAGEADLLHVDCMDGHYVPNLTIGPPVVEALRKHTDLFLDCHLMVDNPGVLLDGVRRGGRRRLHRARRARRPAAAVRRDPRRSACASASRSNRETPFDAVEPYLDDDRPAARDERAHRVRRPAVHPRGARQGARRAQARSTHAGSPVEIEIDGGIKIDNAHLAVEAGVDILVSGTGIFGADDPAAARARDPRRGRR